MTTTDTRRQLPPNRELLTRAVQALGEPAVERALRAIIAGAPTIRAAWRSSARYDPAHRSAVREAALREVLSLPARVRAGATSRRITRLAS